MNLTIAFVLAPMITWLEEKITPQNLRVRRPKYEIFYEITTARGFHPDDMIPAWIVASRQHGAVETFLPGEGNTIASALADRKHWDSQWAEYGRQMGMSTAQRQAEAAQKRGAEDNRKRTEAAAMGLLYQDSEYWSSYHNKSEMKAIFDGRSRKGVLADLNIFSHIYLRYHAWYYGYCKKNVPEGSPGIKYTEIVHYRQGGLGGVKFDFERPAGEVRVRQKMWPKFQYHNKEATIPIPAMDPRNLTMSFREIGGVVKYLTEIKDDMDRLFSNNTCDSASLTQFDENLYRIAEGIPTLQEQAHARLKQNAPTVKSRK